MYIYIYNLLPPPLQIRFCDRKANPWFDAVRGGWSADVAPLNCTWGFHPPPPLPESSGAKCMTDIESILANRRTEVARKWQGWQVGTPAFWGLKQTTVWSTRDRVTDLFRKYI